MKKYYKAIMIICIFGLSINLQAQLKVKSNGSVRIGAYTPSPSGGKLEITGQNETLDARIFVATNNIARLWTINHLYAYGFGIDPNGIGHIYKNINFPSVIMTFDNNGRFGIGRDPSYSLDVNGDIRANSVIYSSGAETAKGSSILNIPDYLYELNGVSFRIDKREDTLEKDASLDLENNTDLRNPINFQYRLLEQQVKEYYPELVYEDEKGTMGIDYVSFIPLLIEAIKSQKASIDLLRYNIETLQRKSEQNTASEESSLGSLYQNHPNPFNRTTVISMHISEEVSSASLRIYDFHGHLVRNIPVKERNDVKITISDLPITPGTYLYVLVVDNHIIDTKTMIYE